MMLAGIEEGSAVFIDANVFIYHFVGASTECTALLGRCETGEVHGSTSALVLAEVSHRLMMIEAVERKLVTAGNVARKLARRPDVVRQLAVHEASIQAIPAMQIEITPVTEATILLGLRHQRRYGLLTNDSLIVASMQQQGVRSLATADRRLAIVDEIEVLVPADLSPS